MSTESATRKEIIDFHLKEAGWDVLDRTQVIEEVFVSPNGDTDRAADTAIDDKLTTDGSHEFSDYILLGRNGKPLAVVEAKKSSTNAELGREQVKQYCHNIHAKIGGDLLTTRTIAVAQFSCHTYSRVLARKVRIGW